jgi:glycosyltransferase involved in cell wall biosynthesis
VTPENCEVIEDFRFTFHAGDADDLRRMMEFLLDDALLRDAVGRRARARIEQNYLWDDVTAKIEETYYNVLGRKKLAASVVRGMKKTA